MQPHDAVDLCREAITVTLLISAPVLVAGLVVGLIVGLVQALTQIQEQSVTFVPKLVAMVAVLTFTLPWLVTRLMEYTQDLYERIPVQL